MYCVCHLEGGLYDKYKENMKKIREDAIKSSSTSVPTTKRGWGVIAGPLMKKSFFEALKKFR